MHQFICQITGKKIRLQYAFEQTFSAHCAKNESHSQLQMTHGRRSPKETIIESGKQKVILKTESSDRVLRILIVDDCPDTISSMQTLCKLLGFDSLGVKNGVAALKLAEEYRPDIVIMDISMPLLDGYEAARLIRQLPDGEIIVLAAMTGWGGEAVEEKAREAGFDHYWLKPVNFDVMRTLFTAVQRDLHSCESQKYRRIGNSHGNSQASALHTVQK